MSPCSYAREHNPLLIHLYETTQPRSSTYIMTGLVPCRLMKNLPDSLSQLLSLAAQSSSARSTKPLPIVAAQHQAVQQELILGDGNEWRNLLVRVLPGLKQVA